MSKPSNSQRIRQLENQVKQLTRQLQQLSRERYTPPIEVAIAKTTDPSVGSYPTTGTVAPIKFQQGEFAALGDSAIFTSRSAQQMQIASTLDGLLPPKDRRMFAIKVFGKWYLIGANSNDDIPSSAITWSISSPSVTEGVDAYAVFDITLSAAAIDDVTISFVASDGTATSSSPADYTTALEVSTNGTTWTAGSTLTITTGNSTGFVRVPIVDDGHVEPTEEFYLDGTVTAGSVDNMMAQGTSTIADNDPTGSVSTSCCPNAIPFSLNVGTIVGGSAEATSIGTCNYVGNIGGEHTWRGTYDVLAGDYVLNDGCPICAGDPLHMKQVEIKCNTLVGWLMTVEAHCVSGGSSSIAFVQGPVASTGTCSPFDHGITFQAQLGCNATVRVYE